MSGEPGLRLLIPANPRVGANWRAPTRHHPGLGPVHGAIDTGLETYNSTGLAGGAWLSVRTGPVLTYCQHPDHATRRAAAWNAAMLTTRNTCPWKRACLSWSETG
jgi:hypothetical protein